MPTLSTGRVRLPESAALRFRDFASRTGLLREDDESGDTIVALSHSENKGEETGKEVELPWVHVWRFSDGKVKEVQALTDTTLAADALGAI